jgi:hypothetical protein
MRVIVYCNGLKEGVADVLSAIDQSIPRVNADIQQTQGKPHGNSAKEVISQVNAARIRPARIRPRR